MKRLTEILGILTLWALASCEQRLLLDEVSGSQKIVLLGELAAGDTVLIRGGQSRHLSQAGQFTDPDPMMLVLRDQETGLNIPLSTYPDFNSSFTGTHPYSATEKIKSGSRYRIEATHAQLGTVTATVNVPAPFQSVVSDTGVTSYGGVAVWACAVELKDAGEIDHYYMVEAVKEVLHITGSFQHNGFTYFLDSDRWLYDSLKASGVPVPLTLDTSFTGSLLRVPVFTDDIATENLQFGSAAQAHHRILLSDKSFNGAAHRLQLFLDLQAIQAEGWKGRVELRVQSIDKSYFQFLRSYEQRSSGSEFPENHHAVKIEGNVEGGLGIIGGVYRNRFIYYFDDWGI